ncbi:MAG: GMC family oxidoreductase [Pseudomonadota bacterium]
MTDFDFVIVGSGISGGWVAKELSERGFKVAVLERGRDIDPATDYTDFQEPWDFENLGQKTKQDEVDHPIQSEVYAFHPYTRQFWVNDNDYPYETPEGQSFKWRRGHHKGGRSIMWGRQSYRMSETDFEANRKDGHGVDWPVRYNDIAPWYDHVERFAGISGSEEGLEILPDGVFQPPFELNCVEQEFKNRIETEYDGRRSVIPARVANLTQPTEEQMALGRGMCQSRNHCHRGCSFGAYFSSNSSTLPAAERTGNCTMLYDTVVLSVEYDDDGGRAQSVKTLNTKTGEHRTISFRAIFLNASTIATATILLNSVSEAFPTGLANRSGHLGRNLIDHVMGGGAFGIFPGYEDKYYYGRKPAGFYIPRFRNHTEDAPDFVRGYGFQGIASRLGWGARSAQPGLGEDFKNGLRTPGPWVVYCAGFGEILPNYDNHVRLHPNRTDKDGLPVPILDAKIGENEEKLIAQMSKDSVEMLQTAGCIGARLLEFGGNEGSYTFGNAIHEMGTARMGHDPSTSVLNKWNQAHEVPNLFITDGSFMASGACQNPSLSYMAFSARAADHAAELMRENVI